MNKYIKYGLALVVISIIGIAIYFFAKKSDNHSEMEHQNEVYTCSMHPEIIRDKPGNCPICGMTLVKKVTENNSVDDNSIDNLIKPTDNFIVGNYQTTTAIDTTISSEINLPGIVEYDPNSSVNIAARMSGRIEKLFDLYSPELLTEQQNFIYMVINDVENPSIINASRQKLMLYGMTQSQINVLSNSKKVNPIITIYSPASGIIDGTGTMDNTTNPAMQNASNSTATLDVKEGSYIKKGEVIFKLLNTDKVWGIFNVIQGYNSIIKSNQSIRITTELDKDEFIDAKINFVETQLNTADKTNRIRVYLNNNKFKLPIGLRLQGVVKTNSVNGIWIQKQSMVSIGNKKIVFLKMDNGFKASTIKTGIEIDDFIQIIEGISVKDTIAKNAQYLIDSESFIKTE